MQVSDERFYVTGGTLQRNAASYVPRQADSTLLESLRRGDFCYVLNSRQMGKSSLMVRTADRLKAEGISVAVLDLTAIGQNLTPAQWYAGLLALLGEQLQREDELEDFWLDHTELGPLQRFHAALRQVVLSGLQQRPEAGNTRPEAEDRWPKEENGRPKEGEERGGEEPGTTGTRISPSSLVIFVDEIDAVRSLPFSADEFFSGIRECYNRRAQDPVYYRLTFCLLGVATPADLIKDTRTSPFNVGTRIELRDFTPEEAAPLAGGLTPNAQRPTPNTLLHRILYWTNGHPYLTQRLCQAVSQEIVRHPETGMQTADVDRLCTELFLTRTAQESDDNIAFVRARLLRSEVDLADLLDLYRRMRSKKRVPDDETSPLAAVLKLSGVAQVTEGRLMIRNRIYDHVFDNDWILAHMPDAELRRQRAAYRMGLVRATAIYGVMLALMTSLALMALYYARRAQDSASVAQMLTERSEKQAIKYRKLFYFSNIVQMQDAWRNGNGARVLSLLQMNGVEDNPERDFEWGYWNWLCHRERPTQEGESLPLSGQTQGIQTAAFSQEGTLLATGHQDGLIHLWDADTGREIRHFGRHEKAITCTAFSPDGKTVLTGSEDGTARLWEAETGKESLHLIHPSVVTAVAFTPDGRSLVTGGDDGAVRFWDIETGKPLQKQEGQTGAVQTICFDPARSRLFTGGTDKRTVVRDIHTGRPLYRLEGQSDDVLAIGFSEDGKRLLTGGRESGVTQWIGRRGAVLQPLLPGLAGVKALVFTPKGKRLITASGYRIKLRDVDEGREVLTLRTPQETVEGLAISPDGSHLLAFTQKGTAYLWMALMDPDSP